MVEMNGQRGRAGFGAEQVHHLAVLVNVEAAHVDCAVRELPGCRHRAGQIVHVITGTGNREGQGAKQAYAAGYSEKNIHRSFHSMPANIERPSPGRNCAESSPKAFAVTPVDAA